LLLVCVLFAARSRGGFPNGIDRMFEFIGKFCERGSRVTPHGRRQRIVFAELIRVFIDVHQPQVSRNGAGGIEIHVLPQQIHPDDQQDIVLVQPREYLG
jgi:hypothetical protein